MPIYNNPAIGQSFERIAGMFAPPSGAEAAGWAAANAKNAEAKRLADFFSLTQDPNADWSRIDRMGVGAGAFVPTQTMRSVEMDDATKRYGVDVGATTSRANNAATVAGGIEQQKLSSLAGLFGPLSEGQVRPELPAEIAGMYGASGALPQADGRASPLSTDEVLAQAILGQGPGVAQQYAADKFAPSETQVKGRIVQGLPETDQRDLALGDIPIEQIIAEDGVSPVYVRRPDAVGQTPFINKGAEAKPTNGLAVLPDGSRVPAIQGPDGRWADAQTGQPLPAGIQVFDMPKPTGTNEEVGLGTKTNLTRAQALRATVSNTNGLVNEIEQTIKSNPAASGMAAGVLSFAQDARQVVSEFSQSFGGDANSIVTPDQLNGIVDRVLPPNQAYNPVYRKVRAQLLELAYANAKLNNPDGEVSRFALERELDALGQGVVGNDQGVLAVLDVARDRMRRALGTAETLTGERAPLTPDQIGTGTSAEPAPAASGGARRLRYNPATGALE
ncbi:MAG: hypothetical protein Unbinned2301contig1004_7 [Prokaryotic dsDNA virus sp.]|nr:MAG: hypothetical protein Unbinned2301contig1004_7 [Prokaryotic dsDNA virus sp.]|tara:strand:- start:1741 stop:3249 length:1509 start_codon:yes stop_codon:yes gene_type:complete